MQKNFPKPLRRAVPLRSRLRLLALSLMIPVFIVSFSQTAVAEDRVFRVLLDGNKVFPTLGISATGIDGSTTSLEVKDCLEFDHETLISALRFEMELTMICNVVRDADLADRFEFVPYPNLNRAVADLEAGKADFVGESVFRSEAGQVALASDTMIRIGDFEVGVFTTPNRLDVLSTVTQEQLRMLSGITVRAWTIDVQTLYGMGLQAVQTARALASIPPMIESRRADFTLSYLDRTETDHMGSMLVRVDGFRVSFSDERVFIFSPGNTSLQEAMNSFIQTNRQNPVDRIQDAYKNSGFIVEGYEAWIDATKP